jgi:hypothetical protein
VTASGEGTVSTISAAWSASTVIASRSWHTCSLRRV